MDMYEEMLLQIVDVLKKHNKPLPDLTHKEAIEEIRSIVNKDYYSLDDLPKEEVKVELKYNPHKCGNCRYLIFKDYKHNSGTCTINRLERSFTDICTHEEEIS